MLKFLFKLFKATYVKHLDAQVEKYYNIYHFSMDPNHTSYNNEGDAFKHTFMSAEFSFILGKELAYRIGVLQEDLNPYNTEAERHMDLHNDEVGIEIGQKLKEHFIKTLIKGLDDSIAEKVMDEMNAGNLITHI